jgi:hypothetical protein
MAALLAVCALAFAGTGPQPDCVCQSAGGSCMRAHGSPGCGVSCCCVVVCEWDSFCCDVQWDFRCVEEAAGLCQECSFCRADVDHNDVVDGADLGRLLTDWGMSGRQSVADIDESGAVDGGDLGELLSAWGPCFPGCG